jgi:ribosome biogenesis protein Nip4
MIVYISDLTNSIRKQLQLISTFCKVAGYKIYYKNKTRSSSTYTNDKSGK